MNPLQEMRKMLNEQEIKARADLKTADELLSDATSKLEVALSNTPLNKQSVTIAKIMLDTAKSKCQPAMDVLDSIRGKQKSLDTTTHKLLGQGSAINRNA